MKRQLMESLRYVLELKEGDDEGEVEMTKKAFKREHRRLKKVLKKCKHKSAKEELSKQQKEMDENK